MFYKIISNTKIQLLIIVIAISMGVTNIPVLPSTTGYSLTPYLLIHSQEISQQRLDAMACFIQYQLKNQYGIQSTYDNQVVADESALANGPLIGIDPTGPTGMELFGALNEKKMFNFIYLFPGDSLLTDNKRVVVSYGLLLKRNLKTDVVTLIPCMFHVMPQLDFFIPGNSCLRNRGVVETLKIPQFNDSQTFAFTHDKARFKQFLTRHTISTPLFEVIEPGLSPSAIEEKVVQFCATYNPSSFVVKPTDGSMGVGVKMYAPEEKDAAVEHVRELLEKGRAVLLEVRAHSFMVTKNIETAMPGLGVLPDFVRNLLPHNPKVRLDWNMRVLTTRAGRNLVFSPQMIEVRYQPWGDKPVNKSQGAQVIALVDFFREVNVPKAEQDILLKELYILIKQIYEDMQKEGIQANLLGWDIIYTEEKKLVIIELNSGNVGGIQTLENLYYTTEEARKMRGEKSLFGSAVKPFIEYARNQAMQYRNGHPVSNKQSPVFYPVFDATDIHVIEAQADMYAVGEDLMHAEELYQHLLQITGADNLDIWWKLAMIRKKPAEDDYTKKEPYLAALQQVLRIDPFHKDAQLLLQAFSLRPTPTMKKYANAPIGELKLEDLENLIKEMGSLGDLGNRDIPFSLPSRQKRLESQV